MKHILLMLLAVMLGFGAAQAQGTLTVSGHVVDASGEELIGVAVNVMGTNQGAMTDIDGNYTIANVAPTLPCVSATWACSPRR